MILQRLSLTHFRSYTKRTFQFSPQSSLIVGPNAAGKTNILEAIMFCATGKSFRADADREAIRWGSEMANVKCQMTNLPAGEAGETQLELFITSGEVQGKKAPLKKYLVNGVPRRMVDFVGNLRAVLFWPEHLELVTNSPSLRRKYLDSVLVQVDREYRRNLTSYERGLRQRNKLLDGINEGSARRSQLLFWDQLLIAAGGYLTDARAAYIDYVNSYQLPADGYQLEYDKSVISESRLEQYADEEVAAKATLVGPHRDDIVFYKENKNLSTYGSRGEQRLAVLWLKLSELSFIEKKTGERPILLLDDIFSELDETHRGLVMDLIGKQQTVLTSADRDIMAVVGKEAQVIQL